MVANNGDDPYFSTLESIMRITLAGFGGALAGLSFAKRRGGSAVVTAATRQATSSMKNNEKLLGGKKRLKRQTQIVLFLLIDHKGRRYREGMSALR